MGSISGEDGNIEKEQAFRPVVGAIKQINYAYKFIVDR